MLYFQETVEVDRPGRKIDILMSYGKRKLEELGMSANCP